jgi:DNA polymerase theta
MRYAIKETFSSDESVLGKYHKSSFPKPEFGLDDPKLDLPEILIKGFGHFSSFHTWQHECISMPGVLDSDKNLVISAPTSSGKSLVYQIIALFRIIQLRKKALIVLPFVSMVCEVTKFLVDRFTELGFRFGMFFANEPMVAIEDIDVAICTIEKGSSVVSKLIEESRLELIGTIVVDEIHYVNKGERGKLLELLLTKVMFCVEAIKIIGISATFEDLDLIVRWLDADSYKTDYRPIKLVEMIKLGKEIFDVKGAKIRELKVDLKASAKFGDPDCLIPLVYETVSKKNSVIVFCAKKIDCENAARNLARLLSLTDKEDDTLYVRRSDLLNDLGSTPFGLDELLSQTVPKGIAYHHSGLTTQERELLEDAFREGILLVLCATSTIASGVNLPAARIIFRSPYVGRNFIQAMDYEQMRGRAGRFGQGSYGESIVMVKNYAEFSKVLDLKRAPIYKTQINEMGMKRAILELVSLNLVRDFDGLILCLQKSLYCTDMIANGTSIEEALTYLIQHEFLKRDDKIMELTSLGFATVQGSLQPEDALFVHRELQKALNGMNLWDCLHILYFLTPLTIGAAPDWISFFDYFSSLPDNHREIGKMIGISSAFLASLAQGLHVGNSPDEQYRYKIHVRFYNCLILFDSMERKELGHISRRFGASKGTIQALQNLAFSFGGMVRNFCRALELHFLDALFKLVHEKLVFGSEAEILELIRVQHVTKQLARIFFKEGIKSIQDLSVANTEDIAKLLFAFGKDSSARITLAKQIILDAKDIISGPSLGGLKPQFTTKSI